MRMIPWHDAQLRPSEGRICALGGKCQASAGGAPSRQVQATLAPRKQQLSVIIAFPAARPSGSLCVRQSGRSRRRGRAQ